MATGHSIIPINNENLSHREFLENDVFFPTDLPYGRFPTLDELRGAIYKLGYNLEESNDWYVTSPDDFTEIWFRSENDGESNRAEFWFRRGHLIVLDIVQAISNQCGSFLVFDHSGMPAVLVVPSDYFISEPSTDFSFLGEVAYRLPIMVERLTRVSTEDVLFILSQIRQALGHTDYIYQHKFFQIVQQSVSTYASFLTHTDTRVRYLAFDLTASFQEKFYEYAEILGKTLKEEIDSDTKAQMIWVLEKLIKPRRSSSAIDPWKKGLLEVLENIITDLAETASVRFAAANLLVRSQPGFVTPTIRTVFTEALIHPEGYLSKGDAVYGVSQQTLTSVKHLMLHDRIIILLEAVSKITVAQDAHEVLHALLDNVFFGEIRDTWKTILPDNYEAERPSVGETRFREHLPNNWLYPTNPAKVVVEELLPFQREILLEVLDLEVPWMVYSNLLGKYGLPPTRASVQALLKSPK